MSKVQWLGDPISDCKASLVNKLACESFAGTVSIATGSYPLQQFYKDQCIEYLCSKGSMPTSPGDLPEPPGCKEDQANRDKCAAFGSALAVASGSAPLGPFYRDQCLEYLCANGKMPTPGDMPKQPYPWGVEAPETKALQEELNVLLQGNGYCPIPVTRKLDAATCGAAQKFGKNIPSCDGYIVTAPKLCPPQPKTKPQAPLAPAGAAPTKETPWGWYVLGAAAVAGAAWWALAARKAVLGNPSEPRPKFKIHLERVRLNSGGYDSRGRYWGVGAPLYRYSDDSGAVDGYVRASNRTEAKEKVRYQSPGMDVSFYRA